MLAKNVIIYIIKKVGFKTQVLLFLHRVNYWLETHVNQSMQQPLHICRLHLIKKLVHPLPTINYYLITRCAIYQRTKVQFATWTELGELWDNTLGKCCLGPTASGRKSHITFRFGCISSPKSLPFTPCKVQMWVYANTLREFTKDLQINLPLQAIMYWCTH